MGDDSHTRVLGVVAGLALATLTAADREAVTPAERLPGTAVPGGGATPLRPRFGFILHDNGVPDGTNAYSNATRGVFGARRTLLDDFATDGFGVIDGLQHFAIWNTLPPGSGTDMEIAIRQDVDGAPGNVMMQLRVISYGEFATGVTYFDRPEYEAWTEFEPVSLARGRYWIEATVVGPENNYWLVTGGIDGSPCWVDYEDFGGLQSSGEIFGEEKDLAWRLFGGMCAKIGACCLPNGACVEVNRGCVDCDKLAGIFQGVGVFCDEADCRCRADFDGSGHVDFADILAMLSVWGRCVGCVEDLDRTGAVDVADLLALLAAWGPCV